MAANLVTAGAYVCVGATTTFSGAVTCLMLASLGRSITAAVTEAMLVELVRPSARNVAGKTISDFLVLKSSAALLSSYFGGLMLESIPPTSVLVSCAALPLFVMIPVTANLGFHETLVRGNGQGKTMTEHYESVKEKVQTLRDALFVPVMTAPLLLFFTYISGPNYDDALYYFYINKLALDPEYMGRVQLVHHFARMVGIASYRLYLHKVPARAFIIGITVISVPLYMTPLLLTTGAYEILGIEPKFLALSGELFRELCLHLQMLPLLTLWARQSPKGLEGTSFSVLTSIGTTGKVLSRLSSSAAATLCGVSADNFDNLSKLICVCASSLVPPLYFVKDWPGDVEQSLDIEDRSKEMQEMLPAEDESDQGMPPEKDESDEDGVDTDPGQRILP